MVVDSKVAASTQNQAFNALLFLYRDVLKVDMDFEINAIRAKRSVRLPVVMTKDETLKVIAFLTGINQLIAKLLYGSGLRLMECLRLRVKDINFDTVTPKPAPA